MARSAERQRARLRRPDGPSVDHPQPDRALELGDVLGC